MLSPSCSEIRVLIVDDDAAYRQAVHHLLPTPYVIVEAQDGTQARELLRSSPSHCVLMDYNIPGTDILTLLGEITPVAPVVMLTRQADPVIAATLIKAGAEDYLTKEGITTQSLDQAVRRAIDKKRRQCERHQARQRLRSVYRAEKQKREDFQYELEVAGAIQQQLIPEEPPHLPGFDIAGICVPARHAGGDFFDYVFLADGSTAVVLADVSGHGVGPAILAAETRAYTRALASTHSDIGLIATALNGLMYPDLKQQRFVTYFLLKIQPRSNLMSYTAMGHEGHLFESSGAHYRLRKQTAALGFNCNTIVPTSTPRAMHPGDILLLISDGVTDVFGPEGTPFGEERCMEIVRAHREEPAARIVDHLYYSATTFMQDEPQEDDITIVLVRKL
jgi:serine phosphatase RsbU (regulator of sigma subunit)